MVDFEEIRHKKMVGYNCKTVYRNVNHCGRVNGALGGDFLVQIGLHQGSVLNPMLLYQNAGSTI